jgi:hypothetical protein
LSSSAYLLNGLTAQQLNSQGLMKIIDSHIHCGIQNVDQPFSHIAPLLASANIQGACLFAPVEDIYDRYHRNFDDNQQWRQCRVQAHTYLKNVAAQNKGIHAYYFVWNDFAIKDLDSSYKGIKWHHHAGEPPYRYQDPRCEEMIGAICERKLPIVLEETFRQTMTFIERIAGRTPIIIPHLGLLNGGFKRLLAAGVWENANIYADTALAGKYEIETFLSTYGPDRLIFGSDYPFGMPVSQLRNVTRLGIDTNDLDKILSGNILTLLSGTLP